MKKLESTFKAIWMITVLIGVPAMYVTMFFFMDEWWEYMLWGLIGVVGIIVTVMDNIGTWDWRRFPGK